MGSSTLIIVINTSQHSKQDTAKLDFRMTLPMRKKCLLSGYLDLTLCVILWGVQLFLWELEYKPEAKAENDTVDFGRKLDIVSFVLYGMAAASVLVKIFCLLCISKKWCWSLILCFISVVVSFYLGLFMISHVENSGFILNIEFLGTENSWRFWLVFCLLRLPYLINKVVFCYYILFYRIELCKQKEIKIIEASV